jgi:hypothetical protein
MKKRIGVIVISLLLILAFAGCDQANPMHIAPTPLPVLLQTPVPTVPVTGNVNAVIITPLPTIPVNINGVTIQDSGVPAIPYYYLIADGKVANHVPWDDLGYLGSASTSSLTVWDGATQYVYPTVQQRMEIVSSSANDTLAGTGIQKVKIYYLDATGAEFTEIVSMSGTTPVSTVATNIYRINDFVASQVGTNGMSVGNIVIRNLATTPVYSEIAAGYTRDRSVIYTVPKGKTLFVTSMTFGCVYTTSGKSERFTFLGTYDDLGGTLLNFFVPYAETVLVDNSIVRTFEVPFKLPSLTDIKVNVVGETNAQCAVVARGWLQPN